MSGEVCHGPVTCRWKLCEYWTWTLKGTGSRQGSVEGRRRTSVTVVGSTSMMKAPEDEYW